MQGIRHIDRHAELMLNAPIGHASAGLLASIISGGIGSDCGSKPWSVGVRTQCAFDVRQSTRPKGVRTTRWRG